MKHFVRVVVLLAVAIVVAACAGTQGVSRVAADQQTDLSGRWNDTDSRLVAEAMVADVIKRVWIDDFFQANGRKPAVIVGAVRNRSSEHIDASLFTKDIERELVNSGRVKFVANAQEREGLRAERLEQQNEASEETMKRLGQETGADFMLQGQISSVTDAIDGKKTVFYKINLELVHIETNEKVWIGDKQIKKIIDKAQVRW